MNKEMNENEYLEIDLRKYFYLIWQKKLLLISIVILAVLTTFIVNVYFMDREYTAISTVRLGNIGSNTYTEPAEVKNLIKSRSFSKRVSINLGEKDLNSMLDNDYYKLEVSVEEETDYISIKGATNKAELSARLANAFANTFVAEGSQLVEKETALMEEYKEKLSAKSDANLQFDSNLKRVSEQINELETDTDPFESSYLLQSIISLEKMINQSDLEIEEKIFELEQQLLRAEKPEFVTEAAVSDEPSSPNIALNISLALVLSFLAALFLIFSLEFFKNTNWEDFNDF
jgi:capsular polysaccharide biosynthesis protein